MIRNGAIMLAFITAIVPQATVQMEDLFLDNPPVMDLVYKKVGRIDLHLHVAKPADWKPGDKRTAVVWFPGGAWRGSGPEAFDVHARYFATRGAVGFSAQYRTILQPRNGIDGELCTIFDCITDCKSVIRFIRQQADKFGIDPRKIVAMGDSAGGHLSAALGTIDAFDAPDEDRTISSMANATVNYNPIMHFDDKWGADVPAEGPLTAEQQVAARRLGLPDNLTPGEARRRLLAPLYWVTNGAPPAMVLHGANDVVVDAEHARKFAAAMEHAGNVSRLKIYPRWGHAFVVAGFMAPEADVVRAIVDGEQFLIDLGFMEGKPTLVPTKFVDLPRGLIARYPLDAVGERGVLRDVTGNGFDACAKEARVVNDADRGPVLEFAAAQSNVTIPQLSCAPLSATHPVRARGVTEALAVSLWIKPQAPAGTILQQNPNGGFGLAFAAGGELALNAGKKQAAITVPADELSTNQWHQLVLTLTTNQACLYVDGKAFAAKDKLDVVIRGVGGTIGGSFIFVSPLEIGRQFSGRMADLRIYNCFLSAGEARKIFAGQ